MNKSFALAARTSDEALRLRASAVIPGGMWGHQRAAAVPHRYPQFFVGGKGCRVSDVDGNSYIDFMCSWGPIVLGHQNEAVNRAAYGQIEQGDCLNGPTRHAVELAELLVETIPHAAWALFQKNGTDATTACVTIARAATGRRKIVVAKGAYHGAVPWCSPSLVGVTQEDRAHIIEFAFNNITSLREAVDRAGSDLAGILVSSFRHDISRTLEMPTPEFAQACRDLCDAADAMLILDDVRAGFRLHLGGSWEVYGVQPDLSAWSKAIANGWPLAAVTGGESVRDAASRVFVTGSFWYAGAPMVAAIETIRQLHALDAPEYLRRMGQRLRDGLAERASRHGFEIIQSGPPQMPLVQFAGDDDFAIGEAFCREALRQGIYLHPRHNMFLSTAHGQADIDEALDAADKAFAALARRT
ncbi:aminotransferase class III-fold pyridoxal phosphate-dependent enzyme [Saliniramus fredricksonii]|uniref:Glutamate-1-semialdehyde 2,1-aminomutase n=1 Tax=Saliniramus fredricksonii TaxID=1653334 RepID=A0ABY0K9K9_9HYPH|nr:aminotransferase class III-fold pyridoxal phosphate-dependent enzyme [Saliniramus fredricksonii]SCC81163.1 glutamate-1-semialdehyde 2,1-aminomutase [Saliniramus fredricksonii]